MKIWTTLFTSALGAVVMAQGQVLYTPVRLIKDQNITVRSWGSGTVSETDEAAYEGTNSIRISTRNYFQGGSIVLGNPADLNPAFGDKNNLLRIIYKTIDATTTFGGASGRGGAPGLGGRGGGGDEAGGGGGGLPGGRGGGGGVPGGRGGRGGAPGGAPGGFPPGGIPSGVGGIPSGVRGGQGGPPPGGIPSGVGGIPSGLRGGQGGPPNGFGGGRGGAGGANQPPAGLKTLRFIITTTDNKKSEAYVPVSTSAAGDAKGWKSVAVPLQAISGFDRTNRTIKEIALAGDTTSSFFVGDVRIVNDTTPIRGEANYKDINLALGQEVTFYGTGTGGSSVLKYNWDFDSSDGVQVDVEGQVVKRKFRKAGSYIITMTIQDEFGLKAPYSTTIKVKVNP